MANINTFISKLKNGGARPTLFEVTMSLKGDDPADTTGSPDNLITYMCKNIEIPASNLGFATVNYFGRSIKYPGDRTFDDLNTVIINDEGHTVRNKIENWLHKLNGHTDLKRDTSYISKTDYVSDMTVKTYTKSGVVDQTYVFKNCFPTSLDPIDLAWDDNDNIMEFSVTWAYDYWTHSSASIS